MVRNKIYDLMVGEDEELDRRVIQLLVERQTRNIRLVGVAATTTELLIRMHEKQAQLVVLDSHLPGTGLMITLNLLLSQHPQLKVIILADFDEKRLMESSLRFGAFAYLIRPFQPAQLLSTLSMAARVLDTLTLGEKT
jgi:DNA-binding NarL/FixJ family response regulator